MYTLQYRGFYIAGYDNHEFRVIFPTGGVLTYTRTLQSAKRAITQYLRTHL